VVDHVELSQEVIPGQARQPTSSKVNPAWVLRTRVTRVAWIMQAKLGKVLRRNPVCHKRSKEVTIMSNKLVLLLLRRNRVRVRSG
jgi:hypothetical protein